MIKVSHRLLLNYNIICPNCKGIFYSKDLRVKYCSIECKEQFYKQKQKIINNNYYKLHKKEIIENNKKYRKKKRLNKK